VNVVTRMEYIKDEKKKKVGRYVIGEKERG
jgi:hypothetical protein